MKLNSVFIHRLWFSGARPPSSPCQQHLSSSPLFSLLSSPSAKRVVDYPSSYLFNFPFPCQFIAPISSFSYYVLFCFLLIRHYVLTQSYSHKNSNSNNIAWECVVVSQLQCVTLFDPCGIIWWLWMSREPFNHAINWRGWINHRLNNPHVLCTRFAMNATLKYFVLSFNKSEA